jgi:transposase
VSEPVVEVSASDTSGHTTTRMSSQIVVIDRVSGRRYWTVEQKLGMLLRDNQDESVATIKVRIDVC